MDAPTSTGIPTQPEPIKPWKQVAEESNIFSLPAEQRVAEYDKWSQQAIAKGIRDGDFDEPDTFNQFKLLDIRTRKHLASDDIVGPSDEDILVDYNSFSTAFQDTQKAFASQKPTPEDNAIQDEVLKGKRNAAFVRGQMVFNPTIVNDPQKYREAILESDAPPDIKMLYAGLRPEMEKSATVTRRRELANSVITRDVADKVVNAIQEGTEVFGADIGTPQSPALKKNKAGVWSVVDPEYVDMESSMLEAANARYNPLADAQYKPLAAINEYQKKYGLSDEQVQQDYMEALIENAPTAVNRWVSKATSVEDYVKQLDSTVRVKNKDVAPEVRVQDPNLFFDAEGYNAAVDKANAPEEAKKLAKEARTQFADAVAGDIYNNLLANRDDFREDYAKDVVKREDMAKAITRYYKDKKDQAWYDDVGEFIGQTGTALEQGGMNVIMTPSAVLGMFGSVKDAEDVRYATMVQNGQMQAEEAVANRTGGAGAIKLTGDVARILPDLAVQMAIGIMSGGALSYSQAAALSARTGISKAAARTAIRQAAITGEKAALKSELARLIPNLSAQAADDVATGALEVAARTMSNNPLKGGIGTQRAIGSAYAGLTSAGSTFGQVYTEVRAMGKSPEESIGIARTAGITAGAITGALTHAFGVLGRGGVEDFASMGRKAGEFTIRDIVKSGVRDVLTTQEGRQLARNIASGIAKDALHEGVEEGLDQALNLISQYATNPSPEAQNRKVSDVINESLYATLLGGIAGGGANVVGQARATAPGITAQQMQAEILGANAPQEGAPAPLSQPAPTTPTAASAPSQDLSPEIISGIQSGVASIDPDMRELFADIMERKLQKKGSLDWKDVPSELNQQLDTASFSSVKAGLLVSPMSVINLVRGTQNKAPAPVAQSADPVIQEVAETAKAIADVPDTSQTAAALEALAKAAEAGLPKPEFNLPVVEKAPEPVAPTEPAAPAAPQQAPSATFVTELGSVYSVSPDGTTERVKAERNLPGHEGDKGKKERSVRTVYFDTSASDLSIAGVDYPEGSKPRVVLKDGTATLTWISNGRRGAATLGNKVPFYTEPAVGRFPLELWQPRNDVPGYEAYAGMHAGNRIVEIRTPAAEPAAPANAEEVPVEQPTEPAIVEPTAEQPTEEMKTTEEITTEVEAPEAAMARGDRFKDSSGQEYEVWKNRQGTIEAHPVVDGKPVVNRESTVRFSVSDAAKMRNPEDRTDIAATSVVSKSEVEAAAAPAPEKQAKPKPDVDAIKERFKGKSGYDKLQLVNQLIESGELIPAAFEAAETGKAFPAIPRGVTLSADTDIPNTISTDRIPAPKIKATTPEKAAELGVSDDETRRILNGVFLDAQNQKAVSSDGRILISIPAKITGEDRVVSANNIPVQGDEPAVKAGGIIKGNYPPWKQVVPRPESKGFEIDPLEVIKGTVAVDGVNKTFKDATVGSVYGAVIGLIKVGDAYFDHKYIKKTLTAILQSGATKITAQVDDDASPLLLTGDNGAIAVVMPVRLGSRTGRGGKSVVYTVTEKKTQPKPTKPNAVQEPKPDEGVLRQEGPEVGLPEVDQGGRGAEQESAKQAEEVKGGVPKEETATELYARLVREKVSAIEKEIADIKKGRNNPKSKWHNASKSEIEKREKKIENTKKGGWDTAVEALNAEFAAKRPVSKVWDDLLTQLRFEPGELRRRAENAGYVKRGDVYVFDEKPAPEPEPTPKQQDVVVFMEDQNDEIEERQKPKKKRITPGEARKAGIAKQIGKLGIQSNDPESVIGALKKIAASKDAPKHHVRIAKDLLSVLEGSGTSIVLVASNDPRIKKGDERVNGWYDPQTNTAYINLDGPHELGIEETILHELVHASGEKIIRDPQTDAQKWILGDLQKQMEAATKNAITFGQSVLKTKETDLEKLIALAKNENNYALFDILYGVSSLSEYHAHATTSKAFQKFLSEYKEGSKRNFFERFVNSITRLLSGQKTTEGSDAEKSYATLLDLMRENKGDVRLSNTDVVESEQAMSVEDVVAEPIPESEAAALDALPDDATVEDIADAAPKLMEQSNALAIKFKDFASWSTAATKVFGSKAIRFLETIWTGLKSISIAAIIGYTSTGIDSAFAPSVQEIRGLPKEDAVSVAHILSKAPKRQESVAISLPDKRPTETAKPPTQKAKTTEEKIAESLSSFDASVSNYVDFIDDKFESEILGSVALTPAMKAVAPLVGEMEGNRQSGPNKTLAKIFEVGGILGSQDEVPWCAMFISHGLNKAGIPTQNVMANQFLSFGKRKSNPKVGDVVVFNKRNDDNTISEKTAGHVGFFIRESGDFVLVLNGNVGDSVAVTALPKRRVMQYRSAPAVRTDVVQSRARGTVTDEEYMAAVEAGDIETAQRMVDAAIPSVEPGMTRMWRSDAMKVGTQVPSWMESTEELQGTKKASGRWFYKTKEEAEFHMKNFEGESLSYIDIPSNSVESYNAKSNKFAGGYGKQGREYFVTKEMADGRKTTAAIIRDGEGNPVPLSKRFNLGTPSAPSFSFQPTSETDAAFADAYARGDAEAAQAMVDEAARKSGLPILDDSASEAFQARRLPPPKQTIKAFKLFSTKPSQSGALFPLFVGANDAIPQGVWLDAIEGKSAGTTKTGKPQVKSKLGPLAFRPGWHAGDIPVATHIGIKNAEGQVFARRPNEVWAEVEMAQDVDYQHQANQSKTKDLREMPVNGAYRFKTNPNMTGSWIISGSMKVNRVLSQEEVDSILRDNNIQPMPWDGGKLILQNLGLTNTAAVNKLKLADPFTFDDSGNLIPLSQRFNLASQDIRFSRARGRFDLVDAVRAASSGDASTPFQALNEAINANTELTRRIQAESERRSRAYARGKGAILEQIIRAGNSGRLPQESIKPLTDFVNSVSAEALADTRISLSARPQNSTFDFTDSLVTLALNGLGSDPNEIDRTGVHEFWHGLSRFIPDDEIEKMRVDYVAAVKEYISENPWFVPFIGRTHLSETQYDELSRLLSKDEMDAIPWNNWETLDDGRRIRGIKWSRENYRLFRLDEWVAETMADLVRRKQERPTTILGKMARLFRDFIDTLKQALGNPYLRALDAMTMPDEAFGAVIQRYGPVEDNPPVMYGGPAVGMNNQFVQSKARGIVSDAVVKFAPQFNVVDAPDGPSVEFDGRSVTVNPEKLANLEEYEVQDLANRAVVAAIATPKDPIAAGIIQQTMDVAAYNFDSESRKGIRKGLADAHRAAHEFGMAPLAMELGNRLFEFGGATDADVRKSMAKDVSFGQRATYDASSDTKRYSLPRGGELVGPTTFSIKAYHGTPHKVDKFSLEKIGTGEGVQAYGWGLYFAEALGIAEWYRDSLTQKAVLDKALKNPRVAAARQVIAAAEGVPEVTPTGPPSKGWGTLPSFTADEQKAADSRLGAITQARADYSRILDEVFAEEAKKTGNLYTVELLPNEKDFLDWDAPMSGDMVEKIDAAVRKNGSADVIARWEDFSRRNTNDEGGMPGITGSAFYGIVASWVAPLPWEFSGNKNKQASEFLASGGIPGIRYLDGMSRKAGDGSRNYVIFDDKLIKILEENGTPVPQSRARGTELVTRVSGPALAMKKFISGFRSRGMVSQETYDTYRDSDAFKKANAAFVSFIAKDFTNVTNKLFGEGGANLENFRVFSRDATTGEATVSSRGFETRQKAEAFAVTNRYKDYIVSTGQDLINQALGSNGPTLKEDVRDAIEKLTKKGLDDIAKSLEAYKEEYLNYWNLVVLETQADSIDEKQVATLRERKEQWMAALRLRSEEQKKLVDDARKKAVQAALADAKNRIVQQQQFAKAYLPDDLVHQIERAREKIDELSTRLTGIKWLMEGSELQMVIEGLNGVYVTRSYEAFETSDKAAYVAWLNEAYNALTNRDQAYDPIAMERIMPLVRHIKNGIMERRIEDLKKENDQRQVDAIMENLMADSRQVTQVDRVPGQPIEGTEYEQLIRAVAKRDLLRRRSDEKKRFVRDMMRHLDAVVGFGSNIGNRRKRVVALRKEANRIYNERYGDAEQQIIADMFGRPEGLQWAVMTDDEAHDIANVERAISESPGNLSGSAIWTSSINGKKHSTFNAAVNDDFQENLNFILKAPGAKTSVTTATANDWKRLGDKILEHKNDVPAFLRTFLGEKDNPLLRVSDTIMKQSHLIAVGSLYQNIAKMGQDQGWLVHGDLKVTDKKYDGWKTVLSSANADQGYENNPLKDMYADPVMAKAIDTLLAANQPSNSAFKVISFVVGASLWNVTAGSVRAIARNLYSLPIFLMNSGILGAVINPTRWPIVAKNIVLASRIVQQSMEATGKVSGGQQITNKGFKLADKFWTGLLSVVAAQRPALYAMRGAASMAEIVGRIKEQPTGEAFQEIYLKAVRLGVANDNVQKEAIHRLLDIEEQAIRKPKDKNMGRFAKALKLEGAVGFGSYLLGTMKSTLQQRSQLYGAPDDFTKIMAWLNEMDTQANIHAKDDAQYKEWVGEDGLFAKMPDEFVKKAADNVTNLIQSHSRVWAHITQFKKAGFGALAAPFAAARAEFYRNAANAYIIAFEEMRSKNKKEQMNGGIRFASALMAHLAMGNAIGAVVKTIFSAFADDDEVVEGSPEYREAVRKLGPEYAKNKNATYILYKNGTFDWVDLSFANPFAFVWDSITAARRGATEKDVEDNIVVAMSKEILEENIGTFAKPQIALDAFAAIRTGYDPVRGVKIWDSQADSFTDKLEKSVSYYLKQAGAPGDYKDAMKIWKASRGVEENGRQYKVGTEVGAVFLGTSIRTVNITDALEQKLAQAKDTLGTRITPLYKAPLRNANDVEMEDVALAVQQYAKAHDQAVSTMQKSYKAAETLLRETPNAKTLLRNVMSSDRVRMSQGIERAVVTGKPSFPEFSDQTSRKMGDLGKKHGDPRLKVAVDTLKEYNQKKKNP